jgi:hypothetical protein
MRPAHAPPEVVASWPAPNYTNHKLINDSVVILNSILSFFVLIFVGLRLYARLYVTK